MDESEKAAVKAFSAEGIPSVYANHAALSMSAVDIRLFLSEISPKELNVEQQESVRVAEPVLNTRLCVIMTPEFAKLLRDSIGKTVEQFEAKFGSVRDVPKPTPTK